MFKQSGNQSGNQSENQSEKKCGKISQAVLLAENFAKKILNKGEKNHQNLVNNFSLQEYMELL